MNSLDASFGTKLKVGIFTLICLGLVGAITIIVNNKPYWWRACQPVKISIEDATGLKMKSAVRSMGIQIGYLQTVDLSETHVDLGICITAPVEVLPSTRAFIRGEGFLGDKFVELKPVRYMGDPKNGSDNRKVEKTGRKYVQRLWSWIVPDASAEDASKPGVPVTAPATAPTKKGTPGRQIPVGETTQDMQAVVNRVDGLVGEMTALTSNLRQAINPEELRATMKQLNKTLENASKTLSPDGGLNQTAQRTMAKLEGAVEQLRDMMTRVNNGEGSVGKILNDPVYAEELAKALKSLNKILGRASEWRFVVDIGGVDLRGYSGSRGYFKFAVWPSPDRYYMLGVSVDPRGRVSITNTTTTQGGITTTAQTTQVEQTGIQLTGMVGQRFFEHRLDLSIGALYGDGAVSAAINFWKPGEEDKLQLRGDLYSRGSNNPTDARAMVTIKPFMSTYLTGGVESFRKVNGLVALAYGAGVSFDDDDIKMLFSLMR